MGLREKARKALEEGDEERPADEAVVLRVDEQLRELEADAAAREEQLRKELVDAHPSTAIEADFGNHPLIADLLQFEGCLDAGFGDGMRAVQLRDVLDVDGLLRQLEPREIGENLASIAAAHLPGRASGEAGG